MPYKDKTKRVESQRRYRLRNKFKNMILGDGTKLVPMRYICKHCGKTYNQGLVAAESWPVQKGWLCPVCQQELPHTKTEDKNEYTSVTHIDYSPLPYAVDTGYCELCHAFPCKHVYQDEKDHFRWKIVKEAEKK